MTALHQPLSELSVSRSFVNQAKRLGLETLADIMEADIAQLKKKAAFTYLWYADLLNLLKRLHLFDEFQDKLL